MTQPDRRRSQRMVWDTGIRVCGAGFQESTFTISVSEHGALILMAAKVEVGQSVVLVNAETSVQVESKVVRIGSSHGGVRLVGVDFKEPSKEFLPSPERR